MSATIPHFHYTDPSKKKTKEWCYEAIQYYWYNTANKPLLWGKDLDEIEGYANGTFSMKPFLRMYKSLAKKLDEQATQNGQHIMNNSVDKAIDFSPLALIPAKLDSAIALIQKIPVEFDCIATDSSAIRKKKNDIDFLTNKPIIEADLQDIADQLQLPKADLGTTENSFEEYSDQPYGFDLTVPEEKKLFSTVMYTLRVETAFEKLLQRYYHLKKQENRRLLETKDQYKYGVSVHSTYTDATTGLPDAKYIFPNNIITQDSDLPDFSDNEARFIRHEMSILDMYNRFGDEIGDKEDLHNIINGKGGYCPCNKMGSISHHKFNSQKVEIMECEIKTLDWLGVYEKPDSKRKVRYFTTDEKEASKKIWAQNTYRFFWLKETDYFFKIEILDGSHRSLGNESYQNYSTNIYRTKKKSAVELSIGENKKAQIADIKLQHAILASLPAGKVIDIKGLRSAIESFEDEAGKPTLISLLTLLYERNTMIIDTTDFDGKNDGQMKPFYEIPGGVKTEVNGYINQILQCASNISRLTGINDQLTGMSANPEGLVGMQKLMINSSINALHGYTDAIEYQDQSLSNNWATLFQKALREGGKPKEAIIDYIGLDDTNILKGLSEAPSHNLTTTAVLKQREEERENFRQKVAWLKQQGVLSVLDEYQLEGIENTKERTRFLAIKEIMWKKEKQKEAEANRAVLLERQKMANDGIVQGIAAKTEGRVKEIYTKGEVDAGLMQAASALGIEATKLDILGKRTLQQDRGQDQVRKAEREIEKKEEVELRQPYPIM